MRRPQARLALAAIAALCLASSARANADPDAPAPYRLAATIDRAPLAANQARRLEPYQTDPAFRLTAPQAPAAPDAALAPAAALDAKPFAVEVGIAARDAGVEPALVHAVIEVESAYRPQAVSPKGAVGLMQVLPATAERHGVTEPTGVADNLRAGTRHLRSLIDRFGDRLDLVLAAYNAGEGAVRKYHNSVPPYRETRAYVPAVMKRYKPVESRPQPLVRPAPQREYMPGTRLDPAAVASAQ